MKLNILNLEHLCSSLSNSGNVANPDEVKRIKESMLNAIGMSLFRGLCGKKNKLHTSHTIDGVVMSYDFTFSNNKLDYRIDTSFDFTGTGFDKAILFRDAYRQAEIELGISHYHI